ncbi:uncharacterized protein LOC123504478 [Portunus trituberculatus]|uniref:uncharacterized protein LOC123504478 n=1 Tax=Portunus trituberculatus TaxID=210409 RepID=UPI001E1D07F1|nr:uncharacterized protein LOC123504478 [Portunus trituberculatus]
MHERKNSGSYEVNERPHFIEQTGWCPSRYFPLCMSSVCSCIIYVIGAIITGITYHHYSLNVICSNPDTFEVTEMHVFSSPLSVVGPCLMSCGGTLFVYIVFQWLLCRPNVS